MEDRNINITKIHLHQTKEGSFNNPKETKSLYKFMIKPK